MLSSVSSLGWLNWVRRRNELLVGECEEVPSRKEELGDLAVLLQVACRFLDLEVADRAAVRTCEASAEAVSAVGEAAVRRQKGGTASIAVYETACRLMADLAQRVQTVSPVALPHVGHQLAPDRVVRVGGVDEPLQCV